MKNILNGYKEFVSKFNMVGSNVLFMDKDGHTENVCTGYSDIESNKETDTHGIYRIASISKVIVAIGLLKLYDKGLVDLDEDISKYLGFKVMNPKYPNDLITLRMVMTQTSSITDDGAFIDGVYKGYDGSNSCDDYITLEDLLTPGSDRFYKGYSDYKPGSTFIYSNLGCGILACVIERITGKYFPEYIKEELLHPLGIYSGFRLEDIKDIDNLVTHYRFENGKFIKHRYYETFKKVQCLKYPIGQNYRGVAGGLYISAQNLSKIMKMLMNKGLYENIRILKEETVEEMETVQWELKEGDVITDPTYHKKGLQMIIMDDFTKKPLIGHFGNAYGLRSFMLYNENGGIIFLCNGADFITDEEHMTTLQKEVIEFLVDKTNL